MKHFKEILRGTIYSHQAMQSVPTYLIMEDDAIIHLGKQFTDMISLDNRMHQYLREQGDGVMINKTLLQQKATERSFSNAQIYEAFRILDDAPDIGKIFKDGQTLYCWYHISTEHEQRIKKAQELWATI